MLVMEKGVLINCIMTWSTVLEKDVIDHRVRKKVEDTCTPDNSGVILSRNKSRSSFVACSSQRWSKVATLRLIMPLGIKGKKVDKKVSRNSTYNIVWVNCLYRIKIHYYLGYTHLPLPIWMNDLLPTFTRLDTIASFGFCFTESVPEFMFLVASQMPSTWGRGGVGVFAQMYWIWHLWEAQTHGHWWCDSLHENQEQTGMS